MTGSHTAAVYVSADIEGCATLVHWDEVRPGSGREYERARRLLVAEVNAALEGAFAGGAQSAWVNDAHSSMRNLVTDGVDPRATLVSGRGKPGYMLEGIDGQDGAVAFFVGYHGAIGDRDAVMAHTYSPRVIWECRLWGRPVGELTINAALAAAFDVPVALVSGDSTTCEEARASVPWAQRVETKRSLSYYAAECDSPHDVRAALRAAAHTALARRAELQLFPLPRPIVLEVDTLRTSQADAIARLPGFQRPAARTVSFSGDDMREVYRALVALITMGTAAEA